MRAVWKDLNSAARRQVKQVNFEAVGYVPNAQQVPIHMSEAGIVMVSGGEGSGKSYVTAADVIGRNPFWRLGYFVGPKYESAHKECDYLYQWLKQIGATTKEMYSRPTRGKIRLETTHGQVVESLSSEEGPKAITGTGESPDWIWMVEAGKQTYNIYLACLVRVNRVGGFLGLSGTPEESEFWYPQLYDRFQAENPEGGKSYNLPTWTNTALYPGGRSDPKIKQLEAVLTPAKFMERLGGVPQKPANLVYPEMDYATHVKFAPYWSGDSAWRHLPVEVWVDPGYDGAYAVNAVQIRDDVVWQIDEVYVQYGFASDVILQCKERPWWDQVKGGVIDVAGRQHPGMRSHIEIWRDEAQLELDSVRVLVDDGVQRHQTFLKSPFSGEPRVFHDPRCVNTLQEYGLYKRHPETGVIIDKFNHALKAFSYGEVYHFGLADETYQLLPQPPLPDQFAGLYRSRGGR